MADPYNSVKAGRLTFKGGSVATLSKSLDKNKKKKNKKPKKEASFSDQTIINAQEEYDNNDGPAVVEGENIYTIDAAKKMSYQELFPVEAKKFGYVAKDKDKAKAKAKAMSSVEEALDDRVKKKADRYCK